MVGGARKAFSINLNEKKGEGRLNCKTKEEEKKERRAKK